MLAPCRECLVMFCVVRSGDVASSSEVASQSVAYLRRRLQHVCLTCTDSTPEANVHSRMHDANSNESTARTAASHAVKRWRRYHQAVLELSNNRTQRHLNSPPNILAPTSRTCRVPCPCTLSWLHTHEHHFNTSAMKLFAAEYVCVFARAKANIHVQIHARMHKYIHTHIQT
jgi:hypothetical protein